MLLVGRLRSASKGDPGPVIISWCRDELYCPLHRWLRRNSLVAQQLTLLDALGPAAVPQSPSYVPATDRNVYGKVFRNIFPLVHLSGVILHDTGGNNCY